MKPLRRRDMYAKDKNGKDICILPVWGFPSHAGRSRYDPATEDKKHRGV